MNRIHHINRAGHRTRVTYPFDIFLVFAPGQHDRQDVNEGYDYLRDVHGGIRVEVGVRKHEIPVDRVRGDEPTAGKRSQVVR